jgi:hypothetical protein
MAQLKTKTALLNSIESVLANNNAGSISAADVRESIADTANSINVIVASGNHNLEFPFYNHVRASISEGGGLFIAESGVSFPNASGETLQTVPYPGANGIQHNQLAGRNSSNDAHTQYLSVDGTRPMEGNLPMGTYWIGASGLANRGLGFTYTGKGDDIKVGTSGNFVFGDNSRFSSGRAVAKAWINFDGSGTGSNGVPVIRSFHNIDSLQYVDKGKYKITFTSGVLKDVNFVAVANSNSRTTANSQEDFARNTVGLTQRTMSSGKASVTYLVLNEAGDYVDAEINDLVVFGYDVGETSQPSPTVIPKA